MFSSFGIRIALMFCLFFTYQVQPWRIIGGRKADLGEYPMMAQIMKFPSGNHSCGAFIVSSKIVMSAAHCFVCGNLMWCSTQYRILVGDVNRYQSKDSPKSRQMRALKKLIPHEEYDRRNFQNDIILIELYLPILFSINVSQGILAPTRPPANEQCVVAGWGTITPRHKKFSEILLATSVLIEDERICNQRLHNYREDIMICAGDLTGQNDSCQGDSGGPLICHENVVVGIVSFGASCALPGFAAAYTDISAFRGWISEKVSQINFATRCINSSLACVKLMFAFMTFAIWKL